ncbi:SUMF1/EgtB/PvdO family nonheme iron enzyme [Thalassospira profundimaris]|uniref:SUMF1/EgtB/PvdO family nonheme iron enzyme n=1 Tax=Thalassospira profundimaris TaxID=502049 RepID=UPI0019308BC2|nr:SUMF1/EgtB/PvdO family nonheme iron enzyme [Thalassospira profundimaris]
MGEDRIYREETEIHQVTVSPFAISRTEITNAQFREFVEETGYVTSVEKPLDPADYPGVPEELLQPGSMVFAQPAGAVDMGDIGNWWRYIAGANWQHPTGPESNIDGLDDHPVTQVSIEDARACLCQMGRWQACDRGRMGIRRAWRSVAQGLCLGRHI